MRTAGVFNCYLEDLVYNPKMLKTSEAIGKGAPGKILWTRSRKAHPGPHRAWFSGKAQSAGVPSWTWAAAGSS
ncbi:MAG: hypothetical protein JW820_06600 [Spirochaetales bacterium]|nr:hypothetical protein [Spirochaetales bacterium]